MVQTQGDAEKERQAAAEREQSEVTKPGEKLRKTDKEAYDNTYNEDGSLKIKTEKPLAGSTSGNATSFEDSTKGDSIESEVVDQGQGHPQSEGSEKVEVKHPKTAEGNDDANKPVKEDSDPDQPATGRLGADDSGKQPEDAKAGENMSGKSESDSKHQKRK